MRGGRHTLVLFSRTDNLSIPVPVPGLACLTQYMSGEDPHLGREMVQPAVEGIQSMGVIANAKHFVLNSQETNRTTVSASVDERTRFEIYYPPFEGAIEAKVGSFMCR